MIFNLIAFVFDFVFGFASLMVRFSSLLHYMLPRKRASEEGVVVEEESDTTTNNNSSSSNNDNAGSAATSFYKKTRIGCFAGCSRESTVNESDRSFSSGRGNDNSNSSIAGDSIGGASDMALGDSNPPEIDEDLHSRQLAVYGRETMRRLFASNVLVSGMQGLGVEIAKNLILAGVKSVTLHDEGTVELWDLSSNFVFSENDLGKNRAVASVSKLQELNNAVLVQSLTTKLTKEQLSNFQVKDMALKFSGAFKGSSTDNKGQKPNPDRDNTEWVPYPYMGGGTSGLTPAWDFRSSNVPGDRSDPRFIGGTSGDKTPSGHISAVPRGALLEEDVDDREWVAQVEPGVHISFVSLSEGGNNLKRIRFSMDVFDKVQAQKWWVENFDRIKELYNVQRINQQALNTPARSDDEQRDSIFSRQLSVRDSPVAAWLSNDITLRNQARPFGQGSGQHMHAGSSSNEPSLSNASDIETEWIEQDQPGVFVTVKQFSWSVDFLDALDYAISKF